MKAASLIILATAVALTAATLHADDPAAGADEALRLRAEWQHRRLDAFRPGNVAADLHLQAADGSAVMLSEVVAGCGQRGALVLLYDPDCEECQELVDELRQRDVENLIMVSINPEAPTESIAAVPRGAILVTVADEDELYDGYPIDSPPMLLKLSREMVIEWSGRDYPSF